MDEIERVIDLKKDKSFIEQYVTLRNRYQELLLTESVNVAETKWWLERNDVEVRGIVKGPNLLGVAILSIAEISFFVKFQNQGFGTKLLEIIEKVAKRKKLVSVWAWVRDSNWVAIRTFLSNGYTLKIRTERFYENEIIGGYIFRKNLSYGKESSCRP